ncbi:Alkaline phosphatase [Colletotrichum higginsianum IMI 349063]|uniref:alkaline phosphatase n=1 Tax=Colletotrichum higginsianum (strain IMI 349063) TaxID=759273 RepID=A0A1B7YRE9_COLHI|nr:Alkaline phosphatase [Colletotrichum higginsianum IMI 349063]OBR14524.1 Alkaline phosphatase [Colletotrichum higginsianum IMI 349063]
MPALALVLLAAVPAALGQTFQRLGACPDLGCVFPPDQAHFLPGQAFDVRVEIHAPVNGTEAFNGGVPDPDFSISVASNSHPDGRPLTEFFGLAEEPPLETWDFAWYEDLFARDAGNASVVNVASKAYRHLALYEPGNYTVELRYYNGTRTTLAEWFVRPLAEEKKAKNVILFIGDGMTTNMITAARLLGHKSINGKYQSRMQMDQFPILGHQMTHSVDTFITDSANSASALYSGHKGTSDSMGVYSDSSADDFDDPKVETIVEMVVRIWGSAWGAVTTAALDDATPAALTGHTRSRSNAGSLIDQALNGMTNYSWSGHPGPDVYFGGGASTFLPGPASYEGKDYYDEFRKQGYSVSWNATSLRDAPVDAPALGVFSTSHLPVWLDRNILTDNIAALETHPSGDGSAPLDLPGLKDMTLKAVDILLARSSRSNSNSSSSSSNNKDAGFFLMSEGASIDKQMHALDYDRALGDLLEFDDTIRATVRKLRDAGALEDTLIVVTADHGHGFDVFGVADTEYLAAQDSDRGKREAIGVYERSGLSQYTVSRPDGVEYGTGPNFPLNWSPRYAIAPGFGANPDRRENFRLHESPRRVVVESGDDDDGYVVNPEDGEDGFYVPGTIPTSSSSGVHSLTDVPVFAMGPCQETFAGVYDNTDVFFKIASCLGLGQSSASPKRK